MTVLYRGGGASFQGRKLSAFILTMVRYCRPAGPIGVIRQNLDALSGECHSVGWSLNQVTCVAAVVSDGLTVSSAPCAAY